MQFRNLTRICMLIYLAILLDESTSTGRVNFVPTVTTEIDPEKDIILWKWCKICEKKERKFVTYFMVET